MITRQSTDTIVIHCAATKPTMDVGVEEITDWHKQRGFDTIGYHYVIRRSGQIEEGRSDELQGAHAVRVNGTSIGICLVGGLNTRGLHAPDYTAQQQDALFVLIKTLKLTYKDANVVGHSTLDGVECPSFIVEEWWNKNKQVNFEIRGLYEKRRR